MDFPKSVPGVGLVAGRYVDENQATGQPGTLITAQAMNALTDEILAVLAEAGMAPDEQANDQLRDAIKTIVEKELEGRQKSLGDGQTWQNVTASRVPGTTYTNTTGRAIFVRVVFASPWPGSRTLYVDGAAVDTQRIDSAITSSMALLAIVPAGSTYSLIAGSTGVSMWMELR
ncbi:hypothetical protein [Comamonas terrigena]|uniref:hypothetical protein n=1 Tax=Comamonas terrigena TaxID=32013 RepID=UPI002448DB61|nr:hypothetical protein [Comamonas terrigena]MDH1499353.1 hypothetical protein [Comamonas terrigena]